MKTPANSKFLQPVRHLPSPPSSPWRWPRRTAKASPPRSRRPTQTPAWMRILAKPVTRVVPCSHMPKDRAPINLDLKTKCPKRRLWASVALSLLHLANGTVHFAHFKRVCSCWSPVETYRLGPCHTRTDNHVQLCR